tara:strand:+ start:351 stop:602 length:252 start_codon:yes stop_codon:yes gene_type:complete
MYGRAINFTLLAPSLWSVVEAVAQPIDTDDMKRNLFKSSDNTGFIIEVFPSKQLAGSNLDVLKAMQSLKEQAMAKVSVLEGRR